MKRKWKEIGLLSIPVLALAAVVPGTRWLADWREANKVPRITSFELRAPTPWEAYNGAEVGYTARMVAPPVNDSDSFMDMRMEFRDEAGTSWNSAKGSWQAIAIEDEFDRQGNVWEARGGLRWKKIVGQGISARVNVVFEEKIYRQTESRAARTFDLKNDLKLVPTRAHTNFKIESVTLDKVQNRSGHEFVIRVRRTNSVSEEGAAIRCTDDWKLISSSKRWVYLDYDIGPTYSRFDANGVAEFRVSFLDNTKLLEWPARIEGVMSVAGGHPQQIRIELLQSLTAQPSTIELPFTATLAPLPK